MGEVHELRVRHDRYMQNVNVHKAEAIQSVDNRLIDMNKSQLLNSMDSKNKPLIHKGTGSPNLTVAYSLRTRKQTPNLFLIGNFQRGMFLDINENAQTWFIDSTDFKNGILTTNYGKNIFGIPNSRHREAKALTGAAGARRYKRLVLNK